MHDLDFNIVFREFPSILVGAWVTLGLSLVSMAFALLIGSIVALLRHSCQRWAVQKTLLLYVEGLRGSPLLVQLFFIYFGLPALGLTLTPFQASVLGLSLNSGAYISEIIRGALMAVPSGQYEAARSLGMTHLQAMLHVVLPQAFRVALPPLVNSFSGLLKDSSLVSILAITELMRIGQLIYTRTFHAFEVYLVVGVIYALMTYVVSLIARKAERPGISGMAT